MKSLSFILTIFGVVLFLSSYSQKLSIKYVGGNVLPIGTKVESNSKIIGSIYKYDSNQHGDTLIFTIALKPGVKIPVGSEFIIYENLFGPSLIRVKYSGEERVLKSSDSVYGKFIPMLL